MQTVNKKLSIFVAAMLWLAMSFQTVHVYRHFVENQQHALDHHDGHQHDHCYVCDFTFSPYVSTNAIVFDFVDFPEKVFLPSFAASNYHHLSTFYFSLRGPPVLG